MNSQSKFRDLVARIVAAARPPVENVLAFHEIDSTHACALRLIEQAEAEEIVLPTTMIIAGCQHDGRGRSDRSWVSPLGGLYLSWVAAGLDLQTISQLPMIAASATLEAIHRLGIEDVAIKWPNDILIGGRKCAGCLVHARHGETRWAAVGIGINLTSAPAVTDGGGLPACAISEFADEGEYWDWAETIVGTVSDELGSGVDDAAPHLARWRDNLCHRKGDGMTVRRGDGSEIRGLFAGLTDEGHLRLDCDGEELTIATGDVVE